MTKHNDIPHEPTGAAPGTTFPRHKGVHGLLRFLRIAAISLLVLLAVVVGLVAAITYYLSPQRLTAIVNQQASEYLDADVKASGIRFTIWSTFPHFYLEADSLHVISRHLKGVSPEIRAQLPANADSLLSTASIRGSVNIMSLLAGKVKMHDVSVDSLRFNAVAFNDSINNYDIFPPGDTKIRIPEISVHQAVLTNPLPLTYYSAATKTSVRADISKVKLMTQKEKNRYVLDISGKVNARYDNLDILDNFPFFLKGDMSIDFSPLRTRLENYTVNLGDTKGKLNLDLDLGDDMSVNSFHYDISSIDIFKLMRYLPPLALPYLDNISADLPLKMSARLTTPYHFSSTTLPSLKIDFNVPHGSMSYTFDKNQKYSIDRLNCRGRFFFDGRNPEASSISVDNLSMSGCGTSLRLHGDISDLLSTPRIEVSLDCNSSFTRMAEAFPLFKGIDLQGDAHIRAHARCDISGFQDIHASGLCLSAVADVNNFAFGYPATGLSVKAGKGSVTLNASSDKVSESSLLHAPVSASGHFSDLEFHVPDANVSARGITVNARANSRGDARIHGSALLSEADFTTNGIKGRLSGTAIDISLDNDTNYIPKKYETALGDSACLTRIPHTPALLAVQTPESIRNFLKSYDFSCRMQANKANITDDADSPLLDITGMDMALTPDRFTLYPTRIDALTTGMNVTARVSGMRDLLVTGQPTSIDADINLLLGVIDINHIAHILEERGINFDKEKGCTGSNANAAAPDDTISCLIPRNINAHIHASAEETIYTNLHLYHLNTDLLVEDGAAHVNDLTIESDFGHARLNALYDTSDIESLSARIGLALEQIDVVTFFKRFHTLLLMMPEMANLSGFVSAECQANAKIFPNMYLNIPSAKADIGVQGTSLKVHQSPFIHKIVNMLLIRTDKDLDIADMSVRATVHDNLLELFPFTFKCDRYTLQMQGLNNFNGDLYYHIGVDKSPIPFPFGVNITGTYRHPQLHFGGSRFKPRQAEKITSDVSQNFRVNIPKELRWFIREFMHKAAQSYLTGEGL